MLLGGISIPVVAAVASGRRRDCGAGNGAEQHAGNDVDEREPARHRADQRFRKIDQTMRYSTAGHELTGQDEQRYGQQRETIDPARHALRDGRCSGSKVHGRQHRGQRRQAESECDGDTQHEQDDEG
jgi:hypothetical protein